MVVMLMRQKQEKWVHRVMSGRKGMLVWKLSRSKIPVSEKKLEKESRWLGITEEHVEKGT